MVFSDLCCMMHIISSNEFYCFSIEGSPLQQLVIKLILNLVFIWNLLTENLAIMALLLETKPIF